MAYIEKLQGYKPHITESFKNWIEDKFILHGVIVRLSDEFITNIMGLPMQGLKFNKEKKNLKCGLQKIP